MKYLRLFLIALLLPLSQYAIGCNVADDPPINLEIKNGPGGGNPRMPAAPVYMNQHGNELSFDVQFAGCVVTLFESDGDSVFADMVSDEGIIMVPESISGVFELELSVGDLIYHCTLTL